MKSISEIVDTLSNNPKVVGLIEYGSAQHSAEEIPQKLLSLLREKGFLKNRIELCVKADLDNQGNYGDSWVAATKKELILLDSKDIYSFTLVKIEELKVENLVSTGILIAKVDGIERTLSRFSNTWVKKFSGFAKLVTRLKEGEKLSETEIAGDNLAAHCPQNRHLYRYAAPFSQFLQ